MGKKSYNEVDSKIKEKMMRTTNPAFSGLEGSEQVVTNPMTISGTINKTLALLAITAVSGAVVFTQAMAGFADKVSIFMIGGMILGLILALVIIFKKTTAPYLAPIYAFAEGAVLGGLSAYFEAAYPGIAVQAISLTLLALVSMLGLYKAKLIRATEKFRSVIFIATLSVGLFYLVAMIAGFFGMNFSILYSSSLIGIGFSLVVVAIAALNFILDFDLIERAAQNYMPKYMEWYCGFGLLVTLVWLYIEMLRLLAKLRNR